MPDKTSFDERADESSAIESPIESHERDQSPLQVMLPQTSNTSNTSIISEQSWTTSASPSSNQQQRKS